MPRKVRVAGKARVKTTRTSAPNLWDTLTGISTIRIEETPPRLLDRMLVNARIDQTDFRDYTRAGLTVEYRGSIWQLEKVSRPTEYAREYELVFSATPFAGQYIASK